MFFSRPPREGVPPQRFVAVCAGFFVAAGISPAAAQDDDVIELPELSVTANLTATPLTQVGSAVTVITGEELKQQNIHDATEALRQVPGVIVNAAGPRGQFTQLRIRGSEGNQTKIFVDGIPVNDPARGSEFDFAHLLADNIERIEVLRGPQSALYGSDAIGGVVNIITRRAEPGTHLTGRLEAGSHKTLSGNATIGTAGTNYDFLAGASGVRTDGISVADERLGNPEDDGYENGTLFAKGGVDVTDWLNLSGVARYTRLRTDLDSEGFLPSVGHTGPLDSNQDMKGDQLFTRAQAKVTLLDGHWEQLAGISYTDQNRDYRDLDPTTVTSTYEGERLQFDYRSTFMFDTPAIANAGHTLTFGVERGEDSAVSDSAWSSFDRSITSTGFIGQYQLSLFEDLSLTAGLRHDLNDVFEDATTYRLTGAYNFRQTGTKLHASYGTGVKNPTLFELYGYTNTYRGNPDLEPEEAKGFDVGVTQAFWANRASLDVTYFNQEISNLITGSGQSSINQPGESKIDGVEVALTVEPVDNLTVTGSYTYTDGEDPTGDELIRRPQNVASLVVNYAFLQGRANVNVSVDYNGEQKDWVWTDALYVNRETLTLDPYTLVDVAASYDITDNTQIYGRVENLLDEKAYDQWGYDREGVSAYAGVRLTF
ncbi:TonB-dependent receptor [Afifella sp. JA880]|uniref:TonB-dependent receptor plug domain-containing protein n=1 Tax=Afifella sp. JA880 TaxID=2975280 RepID=UPI0021BBA3E5|nr:TonB-dependent receptor [Afifella sp. JA880]MCT8267120.1 TonB-dependent receptor [Afifella sp. JA880]